MVQVVKAALRERLRHPDLHDALLSWVSDLPFITWRGALLLNHYLALVLENDLPFPDFKDSFLMNAFTFPDGRIIVTSSESVLALTAFAEEHWDNHPRLQGVGYRGEYCQASRYLARECQTNMANGFKFGLEAKLRRHVFASIASIPADGVRLTTRWSPESQTPGEGAEQRGARISSSSRVRCRRA
eukprot:ANDGO_07022.mRNA.1 hypothetical protein